MLNCLKYNKPEYFNDTDFFIVKGVVGELLVTKAVLHNGSWYSNVGLQYKLASVMCVNYKEVYDKEVLVDNKFTGTINLCIEPSHLGIVWDGGKQIQKYFQPAFWTDIWGGINNLKLK